MASQAISAQDSKLEIKVNTTATEIKEVKSFKGFDGSASELDATTMRSTAKEFRKGLRDNGSFSIELNRVFDDPGQMALDTAQGSDQPAEFVLTLPNGTTATFSALVMSFDLSGGVDALVASTAALRISGAVTWGKVA